MTRKITPKGLKKNLGREAKTEYYGRRYGGKLMYDPQNEKVYLAQGAFSVPLISNARIEIEQYRYNPGKRVWRTYQVSQ